MSEQLDELRESFDGSDQFMTGHQILKTRQGRRRTGVPEWATDDSTLRQVLYSAFPKLFNDPVHKERAGLWLRIVHLYYRMNLTDKDIALEMSIPRWKVRDTIRKVNLVAQGKWANRRGNKTHERGARRRGRPNKVPLTQPLM